MSEQKKYIRVFDIEACNKRYEEGYKVHSVITTIRQEDLSGRTVTDLSYLMALPDSTDYSNVVEVRDAPQDEANHLLSLGEGWTIASTSISSKFYRMVKRDTAKGD